MKTYGDPQAFALRVEFHPCPPLGDEALQRTWCELQMVCQGETVTRHSSGEFTHDGVILPAAPIAAWAGRAWPAFVGGFERLVGAARGSATNGHEALRGLSDRRWDENEADIDGWLDRHALRRTRGGLLLPDVLFWRRGEVIDVSWRADPAPEPTRGVQFLTSGSARLAPAAVLEPWRAFVRDVLDRARLAPDSSQMRAEVEEAAHVVSGAADERVLAARLGRTLDGFRRSLESVPGPSLAAKVERAYGVRVGADASRVNTPVAMAARSASPRFSEADYDRLLELSRRLTGDPAAKKLDDLRQRVIKEPLSPDAIEPFAQGYARATQVRAALRNRLLPLDIEKVLSGLGCGVREVDLDDPQTDGVALWTAEGHALVVANTSSRRTQTLWGRRAMLAHELHHLVYDTRLGSVFGESKSEWNATPTEPEANAFAAELLLPLAALLKLPHPDAQLDDWHVAVRKLCGAYGTGRELTVRHLHNHGRVSDSLKDALLGDFDA